MYFNPRRKVLTPTPALEERAEKVYNSWYENHAEICGRNPHRRLPTEVEDGAPNAEVMFTAFLKIERF